MIDNFYIPLIKKSFKYDKKKYSINDELIYLLPSKYGFFMPTCFFKEGKSKGQSFKKTNKGITGKAMKLLYDENLYIDLFSGDESKYNFFIVIFSIVLLIVFSAALYLHFFYVPGAV
jgi:hypothetical protein